MGKLLIANMKNQMLGQAFEKSVWAKRIVASSELAKGINRDSLKVLFDCETCIFENIGFGGDCDGRCAEHGSGPRRQQIIFR